MRLVPIETLTEADVDGEAPSGLIRDHPQVSLIHPKTPKYLKQRPAFGYVTRLIDRMQQNENFRPASKPSNPFFAGGYVATQVGPREKLGGYAKWDQTPVRQRLSGDCGLDQPGVGDT